MRLKRRAFLQRSTLLLAALGMSEAGLSLLTEQYQRVLAQPTRRKLALLVGINQYPEQVCDCSLLRGTALSGCLIDVELQRELLIHRFGFQPSDIVTLTDQQATRQNIETTFLFHLADQARSGDVVVFHFSGLGSRIHRMGEAEAQNSLVPVDGVLPTADRPIVNDLMEDTLGWLLSSLQTEQVTTILDAGYTDLGRVLQGNLRIRSRPHALDGELHEEELALQEQLISRTQISREQIRSQWRSTQVPGVLLTAARTQQVVTEGQWNGFSAGLFTYALTQQLWWTTADTTLRTSLSLAASNVKQLTGIEQQPTLSGQKLQNRLSAYYVAPTTVNAEGFVKAIDEDGKIQLWLGGLPMAVLENYGASVLAIVPAAMAVSPTSASAAPAASPSVAPLLQIRSREGLSFKARASGNESAVGIQSGQLVREVVRILPRNIGLTVALDTSLERIERVDATSAFSSIPRVSSVIAGEQPADFLFGKTQPGSPTLTASLTPTPVPIKRGYGLFLPGRNVIPNTVIQEEEAVKTAVNRITPQLRTLLALKLLRLTANRGSSHLGIQATLETTAPQEQILMQQETLRSTGAIADGTTGKPHVYTADLFNTRGATEVTLGSRIRYRLQNLGEEPLYFTLMGLDTGGNAIALLSKPENSSIPPKDTLVIPEAVSDWVIQGQAGLAETHLIFSRSPMLRSYEALQAAAKSNTRQITLLQNPLEVVQAVLQDLHDASLSFLPKVEIPTDTYALEVNAWATFSFVYQVMPA